jgi:hypothetical protein
MSEKNIVIVEHRRDWGNAIGDIISKIYPEVFFINVGTLKELEQVLGKVQKGVDVEIKTGFKPELISVKGIDLIVIATLKKDTVESVEGCLGSLSPEDRSKVLDLHLALDGAPNTDFLRGKVIKEKVRQLLNV